MKNFSLSRVTLSTLTIGLLLANIASLKAMEEQKSTLNGEKKAEQQVQVELRDKSFKGIVEHIREHHHNSCERHFSRQNFTCNDNYKRVVIIKHIKAEHAPFSTSSIHNDPESSFPNGK